MNLTNCTSCKHLLSNRTGGGCAEQAWGVRTVREGLGGVHEHSTCVDGVCCMCVHGMHGCAGRRCSVLCTEVRDVTHVYEGLGGPVPWRSGCVCGGEYLSP